jgi:hypothetical protein
MVQADLKVMQSVTEEARDAGIFAEG